MPNDLLHFFINMVKFTLIHFLFIQVNSLFCPIIQQSYYIVINIIALCVLICFCKNLFIISQVKF